MPDAPPLRTLLPSIHPKLVAGAGEHHASHAGRAFHFEKEISDIIKGRLLGGGVGLDLGKPFLGLEKRGENIGVTSRDRARYYPGSSPLDSLVIVSRKDRRVFGAQLAGRPGAVKRIDVCSTAIFCGMTVDEMFDLDLAYAPPFSPVHGPVLLADRVTRKTK